MRKVIVITLAVFAIVIGGGVTISWFLQASEIRRTIEQNIAQLNGKQTYITYESIQTSGFPRTVNVSLVNPRISGRMDQFFKSMAESQPDSPRKAAQLAELQAMPEWNETMILDGALTFSVNAISSRYTTTASGNWHGESKFGAHSVSWRKQSAGDMSCMLEIRAGSLFSHLWSYRPLLEDPKSWAQDFRTFDCNLPAQTTMDANNTPLLSSGNIRFYISSQPQGNQQQVRVFLTLPDIEYTKAGDEWIKIYTSAFPDFPFPTEFSIYGKQNIDIDFSYLGPPEMAALANNVPVDIHLSKFRIENRVYNSGMTFHVTNGMNGAERNTRLAFKFDSSFTPEYDALMETMLRGFIQQIYTSNDQYYVSMRQSLPPTAEELQASLMPALPHFHSLGTVVAATDVSYAGSEDMKEGNISLPELEISATPYGITGNGTGRLSRALPNPAANVTLSCRNCLALVEDVFGYSERMRHATAIFQPALAREPVNPALIQGTKGFLQALSTPSPTDPNTFVYTIISDGAINTTISGKTMAQVKTMYDQYIVPFLPKPAAP